MVLVSTRHSVPNSLSNLSTFFFSGEKWYIGTKADFISCKGCCKGFAHAGWDNDQMCPEDIRGFDWRVLTDLRNRDTGKYYYTGTWIDAKSLAVRCA